MTLNTIYQIFRQIVNDNQYSQCKRLNTFVVMDKADDINQDNFNKDRDDYKYGTYWVRGGIDWTKDKRKFGALILEMKKKTVNLENGSTCYELWLSVADLVDCSNCPKECQRTIEKIDADNLDLLYSVLNEFKSYELYNVDLGSGLQDVWMSKGRKDYLVDEETIDPVGCRGTIYQYWNPKELEVNTWDGGSDGLRFQTTKLEICGCETVQTPWNYDNADDEVTGVVICETC